MISPLLASLLVRPEHRSPPVPGCRAADGLDPYQRVQALMLARSVKLRSLAGGVDVHETTLSRSLHSGTGLDRHWPVIARFFGVSLDWLLTPAPASVDTARNPDQQSAEVVTSSVAGAASVADPFTTPAAQE